MLRHVPVRPPPHFDPTAGLESCSKGVHMPWLGQTGCSATSGRTLDIGSTGRLGPGDSGPAPNILPRDSRLLVRRGAGGEKLASCASSSSFPSPSSCSASCSSSPPTPPLLHILLLLSPSPAFSSPTPLPQPPLPPLLHADVYPSINVAQIPAARLSLGLPGPTRFWVAHPSD